MLLYKLRKRKNREHACEFYMTVMDYHQAQEAQMVG